MSDGSKYLIDTNSLITPQHQFYPFDFAPSFWVQLEAHIISGKVAILDIVKDEILRGKDELQEWMAAIGIGEHIDHREPEILTYYGQVLQYVQENPCYKESALHEWAKASVADPWIIATAMAKGYTIVTFEICNLNLSEKQPSKNAKIPDVARAFGVQTVTLYDMMRALSFKL